MTIRRSFIYFFFHMGMGLGSLGLASILAVLDTFDWVYIHDTPKILLYLLRFGLQCLVLVLTYLHTQCTLISDTLNNSYLYQIVTYCLCVASKGGRIVQIRNVYASGK